MRPILRSLTPTGNSRGPRFNPVARLLLAGDLGAKLARAPLVRHSEFHYAYIDVLGFPLKLKLASRQITEV